MGPAMFIAGDPIGGGASPRDYPPASMGPAMFIAGDARAAETGSSSLWFASMGPAMFIAGDGPESLEEIVTRLASMGPAMFIAGDDSLQKRLQAMGAASMGPAMFIAGDSLHAANLVNVTRGFNGAGDVHRRRFRLASIRSSRISYASMGPAMFIAGDALLGSNQRPPPCASMGPAMFIAGDRPVSVCSELACSCFNGAGDVHRRRYVWPERTPMRALASMGPAMFIAGDAQRWSTVRPGGIASMGPAMFIAGDGTAPEDRRGARGGFNGAGDVHRRRSAPPT